MNCHASSLTVLLGNMNHVVDAECRYFTTSLRDFVASIYTFSMDSHKLCALSDNEFFQLLFDISRSEGPVVAKAGKVVDSTESDDPEYVLDRLSRYPNNPLGYLFGDQTEKGFNLIRQMILIGNSHFDLRGEIPWPSLPDQFAPLGAFFDLLGVEHPFLN